MDSLKKKTFFLYFIEICTLALFMIFSMSLEYLPPSIRDFDPNDKTISFPHTKYEIISAAMLPLFNMVIPTIVLLSVAIINRFKNKRIFVAILGLYFTISLAFLITNVFKSPVGRLRPDFLDRCNPVQSGDLKSFICSGDKNLVIEGRRSFPSGHSSSTYGGMGFIALFFTKHFSIIDGSRRIYKFLIFLIPILIATLVAVSRIVDYRHHWDDVLAGALIGSISAISGYFYFYPLLFKNTNLIENNRTNLISENSSCNDHV